MISNIFDKNVVRVISFFMISPGSRYTRLEIKEKTRMNNVPLDIVLNKLMVLRIIIKENNLLMLNSSSDFNELLEFLKKEYKYFNVPYDIFNIVVYTTNKLSEFRQIKNVYLFGSYSKLIFHDKSDIDIAIFLEDKIKEKSKIENIIKKELGYIDGRLECHFFLEKDIKEKDSLIKDIIKNGKKLL
ncbi:MAG: nucleotidyltransferase domain-containing protein [Nanoarchaeota archaeon]|mgnify:CR=1 FL=1